MFAAGEHFRRQTASNVSEAIASGGHPQSPFIDTDNGG